MTCQVCGNRPSTDVMCNSRIYRLRGKMEMKKYCFNRQKEELPPLFLSRYVNSFTETSWHCMYQVIYPLTAWTEVTVITLKCITALCSPDNSFWEAVGHTAEQLCVCVCFFLVVYVCFNTCIHFYTCTTYLPVCVYMWIRVRFVGTENQLIPISVFINLWII